MGPDPGHLRSGSASAGPPFSVRCQDHGGPALAAIASPTCRSSTISRNVRIDSCSTPNKLAPRRSDGLSRSWRSGGCWSCSWRSTAGANRAACVALATAAAVALLFVTPTLLGAMAFCRLAATRATAPVWGLALNTTALMVVCLLLRQTVGVGRTAFLAAWLAWTLLPCCWSLGGRENRSPAWPIGTRLWICRRNRAGDQPGRHVPQIFAAEDARDWKDWVEFFSITREADGRHKGLLEIHL